MRGVWLPVLVLALLQVLLLAQPAAAQVTPATQLAKRCTFFSDSRSPGDFRGTYGSLANCTWYQSDACCYPSEVLKVFASQFPLEGASTECVEQMNLLMCWICSPSQQSFYYNATLRVCSTFCNRLYSACGSTVYFRNLNVNSGTSLCNQLTYTVVDDLRINHTSCFASAPPRAYPLSNSWAIMLTVALVSLALGVVPFVSSRLLAAGLWA